MGAHTIGKHRVLRNYLNAWFPMLARSKAKLLFVDGFAGPGRYKNGERGSPIVALETLRDHRDFPNIKKVNFFFLEAKPRRKARLDAEVEPYRAQLKEHGINVIYAPFVDYVGELLDELKKRGTQLAPAFVMIDPFGLKIPIEIVGRLLANPHCEVYISFMYSRLNRFLKVPALEKTTNALFGTDEWMKAREIKKSEERKRFLYQLYKKQLRINGANQVVHFDLYDGRRLVYAIFFGSQRWEGADKMKEAILQVIPDGSYAFRPGVRQDDNQLALFDPTEKIRKALLAKFGGKGWVAIEDVLAFVGSDETDIPTSKLKRPVLEPMRKEGLVEGENKRGFPDGSKLRFLVPAE